jgi:hypothetical protein
MSGGSSVGAKMHVQKSPEDFEEGDFRRTVPRCGHFSWSLFADSDEAADGQVLEGELPAHPQTGGWVEEHRRCARRNCRASRACVAACAGCGRDPDPGHAQAQGMCQIRVSPEREAAVILIAVQYLHENMRALDVQLTKEDLARVRELVEEADVKGARYPPGRMEMLYAETPAWK